MSTKDRVPRHVFANQTALEQYELRAKMDDAALARWPYETHFIDEMWDRKDVRDWIKEVAAALTRIAELEAGMKPFAQNQYAAFSEGSDALPIFDNLTVGDFRRARALLRPLKKD